MPGFRCIAMATETADRFRHTGVDDRGGTVHRRVVNGSGFPCRHCLRSGRLGEAMLLASYDLPLPRSVYWTPSPIFLHAETCPRYDAQNVIAPIVRDNSLISLRSYDAEGMCLYDLGHVGPGDAADAPLASALADPRTAYVNIHTARPGCLLCRVERT
ncbi:DUF1203 domain-containing protein [Muricoccus radiodurans]|uniref:DUF1203 domain-containing protein n=1 Tax=Muricoccus radiodurans TaxID=2231721 RepID=UPI003CFADD13